MNAKGRSFSPQLNPVAQDISKPFHDKCQELINHSCYSPADILGPSRNGSTIYTVPLGTCFSIQLIPPSTSSSDDDHAPERWDAGHHRADHRHTGRLAHLRAPPSSDGYEWIQTSHLDKDKQTIELYTGHCDGNTPMS